MRNNNQLLEDLARSAIGRQLIAQRQQEFFDARQKDVEALADARRRLAAGQEARAKATEKPAATIATLREKLIAVEREFAEVERAALAPIAQAEADLRRLERKLRESADPRIAEARAALEARWEGMRDSVGNSKAEPVGYNLRDSRPILKYYTNRPAIERVVTALTEARRRFDALSLANPADLDGAIAEIVASVPFDQLDKLEPVE